MLYARKSTLEDKLVESLLKNPSNVKRLHTILASVGDVVSLRAVYKAANALIDAGVLVKVGKRLWVNQQWVRALREQLSSSLPPLTPGEKVTYTFTSIRHLDVFWKTIAFQFEELEQDGKIFFYNPHNFWAHIPELKESEDTYYAHFAKSQKHAFFTVGGTNTADKEFKRLYQDDFLQIDTRMIPSLARRDHVTVLKDYVITAQLSPELVRQIDELYESNESVANILPDILLAYNASSKVKLTFEHNASKARKLEKILSTNFYTQK